MKKLQEHFHLSRTKMPLSPTIKFILDITNVAYTYTQKCRYQGMKMLSIITKTYIISTDILKENLKTKLVVKNC